jgi:hypothetical protein
VLTHAPQQMHNGRGCAVAALLPGIPVLANKFRV